MQVAMRPYMDMAFVLPGDGYTLRKEGEVKINRQAIERVGGVDAMVRRIVGVWMNMPEFYREVGFTWYDDGHIFCDLVADAYDLTVWQTAQVTSVLSSQNPWDGSFNKAGKRVRDGNKLCALKVIDAFFMGGPEQVNALRGWGYAPMFVGKAIRILQGEELDWSGAPKTHDFAKLLANPTLENVAVADTHASRIATGNLGDKYHVVEKSAYRFISQAYIIAGQILGIPAYVVQAGTWQFAVDGHLYGKKDI